LWKTKNFVENFLKSRKVSNKKTIYSKKIIFRQSKPKNLPTNSPNILTNFILFSNGIKDKMKIS